MYTGIIQDVDPQLHLKCGKNKKIKTSKYWEELADIIWLAAKH